MALPQNFASNPGEELHHYFRNVCIEFKKTLKSSRDQNILGQEIDRFKDGAKQMNWHQKNTGVYHKDPADKAVEKVINEYNRYVIDLNENPQAANAQDLLDAIVQVEALIKSLKAT